MAKNVNITPLHDRVIVKPAPAEEKTAGGIIIPDTAKEKPQRGTVVAAGPGKKRRANDRETWRHHTVWQVCRNRSSLRRRRLPDHARKRYSCGNLRLMRQSGNRAMR
jgi:hypothetical protein